MPALNTIPRNANVAWPRDLTEELFRHLVDGMSDYAIFAFTPDGIIGTWNPGVGRLLGYDETSFLGRGFDLIFTPEDVEAGVPQRELETARVRGKAEDERWHLRKDGSRFWATGLVTRMVDEKGNLTGYTKIMRDRTIQKESEDRIESQANALAAANRELANFAGVVSHDLNTPLQTVYGFANLLKEKKLDSDSEESITQIVTSTERMIVLVRELLRSATALNAPDELELTDAGKVLDDVLADLSFAIERAGALVNHENLLSVWAQPIALGRVFQNLIENALKYRDPARPPRVHVTCDLHDSDAVFTVRDNGRGISENRLAQVFKLFERLETDKKVPGQGIGLASCKRIIEGLGGRIWVESVEGKGSSFHFSIPQPDGKVE